MSGPVTIKSGPSQGAAGAIIRGRGPGEGAGAERRLTLLLPGSGCRQNWMMCGREDSKNEFEFVYHALLIVMVLYFLYDISGR